MKVTTKAYGLIDVDERQKITFPQGLFGFENLKDYVLLDAEQQPFYWLQSIDDSQVAFILINPSLFRADYEENINFGELVELEINSAENALVFSIVTIPPAGTVTANLQGPLVINRDTKAGRQIILSDSRWTTKHDIVAELAGGGK
ncbi:MAG TPA: flagellar assembly protein FliW [Treponema sp.]|nr:flagellar assembly protein FliW [Treponema sp.]